VENRIVADPAILGGKPVVRGARISVEHILELIASGASVDDIVRTYPALATKMWSRRFGFGQRGRRVRIKTPQRGDIQTSPEKKCNHCRMDVLIRQKRKCIQFHWHADSIAERSPETRYAPFGCYNDMRINT